LPREGFVSTFQRVSLLAGVFAAVLVVFVVLQGATQEAMTQPVVGEEPTYQEGSGRQFAPGEIIVELEESASRADLRELNQENDATIEEDLPRSDVNVVDLPRDLTVSEAVRTYEDSPDIAYAEPNFKLQPAAVPNDPGYKYLYGLNNTGQTGGTTDADIDASEAWNTTTGSAGTVVAVIDEGIDINHPDLRDNIWTNPDEISGNGKDDDKNGYVDDINGYDFANNDNTVYDPDLITGNGDEHGTHVAGTIAATANNGVGITGVNWDARIAALKFLGPDGGYTSDAVEAINYAVREGMPISNNSWGGGGKSQSLQDAIAKADAAGHLFVAAAGNGGSDGVGDNNDVTPHYPSNYENSNIISVAATDATDTLASFSNFGATTVDLAAPGVSILSTLPGGYGRYSGTSMATPHVAGVAALIESENSILDDAGIKSQILQFADKKTSLQNKVVTGGRLNASGSVTQKVAPDKTRPSITALRPVPGSKIRDRTPTIRATVKDERTELVKSNIRLFVDGKARGAFSYNAVRDRLSYTTNKLSYSRHTVRIVARDAAGNVGAKSWRFTVRRR
jgi:thermitase